MRSLSFVVGSIAIGAALVACGSTATQSASVSGTVQSTTFTVASELAVFGTGDSSSTCVVSPDGGEKCTNSSSGQAIEIVLTNLPSITCSTYVSDIETSANFNYANADALVIDVGNDKADLAPGTFDIVGSTSSATSGATAEFATTTAKCGNAIQAAATAGSVTLTEVSTSSVAGSYTVTFGTTGTFTGSFNISVCSVPDAAKVSAGNGSGSGTCLQ